MSNVWMAQAKCELRQEELQGGGLVKMNPLSITEMKETLGQGTKEAGERRPKKYRGI